MKICAVIPARFESSRFQGKPLAEINGRPMLWWVYNKVKKSTVIDKVVIALDDDRVLKVCEEYGMDYVLTSDSHLTSTDRVHEVSEREVYDYYVCVNGDEPLIDHKIIEEVIPNKVIKGLFVANLMTKMKEPSEVLDNTNIKVVFNKDNQAVFMSRCPIPYPKSSLDYSYYKHIGVLCYNKEALNFFSTTLKGELERIEDINELRFIENLISIKMILVDTEVLSVDTPKDLEYIRKYMIDNKITYEDIK